METHFMCYVSVLMFLGVFFAADAEHGQFPCGYKYFSEAEGWFKIHLEGTTWSQASRICDLEGAVLASPATEAMKDAMLSLIYTNIVNDNNVYDNPQIIHTAMHPTGADAANSVELQAVGLTDTGNLQRVSQYDSLPYICFKKAPGMSQLNECGTTDSGYAMDNRTQHCYKFHSSRRNWFEAAATCATEGGYLAIINNEEEAQVIRDIFAENPADFIPGWAWKDSAFLGFRADENLKWLTVKEQSLATAGYEGWAPGEPNNARGDELCGSVGRNGKLYDDPCTRELPYICEKKTTNICGKPKTEIVDIVILSPETKADVFRNYIETRASQYKPNQQV